MCLQALGVNLIEYDIDKDAEKAKEKLQKSGNKGIPFIDIEGIYLRGFSEESVKQAVEKRRSM